MIGILKINARQKVLVLSIFCFALSCAPHRVESDLLLDKHEVEQLVEWLRLLQPLQKVHYSWPLPNWMLESNESLVHELLFEYTRITGAISVRGEWATQLQIENAVRISHEVNSEKFVKTTLERKLPVSIGINWSPWHRRFGKELPPTDFGSSHKAEVDFFQSRLDQIAGWIAAVNAQYGSQITVTAFLLDSERFHVRPTAGIEDEDSSNRLWNEAISRKYDVFSSIALDKFPESRIEWYARGSVRRSASETGWSVSSYFPLTEYGTSFSVSLYRIVEIGYARETFRRTVEYASQHGGLDVTPWIALAAGYRRQVDKFQRFDMNWSYDLIYSWQIGAELNNPWFSSTQARRERFAPWNSANIVVFYPEPFGRSLSWGKHFVAYVRGANGLRELPD